MTDAIRLTGVGYRPGAGFAIDNLSLAVPEGAIYGFLGPSGAGKTTTIRLMLGLLRPARGQITVLGEAVPARAAWALGRIGYVPERPHLYGFLTVAESIRFHAAFHPRWDRIWAAELLGGFALPPDRPLGRLSKGEMGKLLMLQALCQRPELLVLDEPTDGLDPVVRRELLSAVVEYVAEHRATVFISSHLVHELERLCDWVGVMDHGTLVTQMPMSQWKNGIKRLRLTGPVDRLDGPPFTVLAQDGRMPGSVWIVDQWEVGMAGWIAERGVQVDAIDDLDLEEGFVERLKARRAGR